MSRKPLTCAVGLRSGWEGTLGDRRKETELRSRQRTWEQSQHKVHQGNHGPRRQDAELWQGTREEPGTEGDSGAKQSPWPRGQPAGQEELRDDNEDLDETFVLYSRLDAVNLEIKKQWQ